MASSSRGAAAAASGDLWDSDGFTPTPFSGGSQGSSSGDEEPYLLGFVLANIVGLRYYSGEVSGREAVALVREPLNPHDPNAIRVLNTRALQVGHIERAAAAALAPLLDSHLLFAAEAIVPKPPPKSRRNPYRLPCQIHLFARPAAAAVVLAALEESGLHLIRCRDQEFLLSEAAIVKEGRGDAKKGKGRGARDVDKLFALVGKGSKGAIAAMEPPRDVIASELFLHQKEGLGWLFHRENSGELPPFWEEQDGVFVNVLTNYRTNDRPPPLRGGIFADDMGLGKTLTLLSLVATSRIGNADGKKPRAAKRRKLGGGNGAEKEVSGARTTLVLCPPSVFSSWVTQLEEHTKAGSLRMYLYHGERTREKEELLKYDIVLTTYSTLASEFGQESSPMKEIEWFRVILDEAHVIKNFEAQQTKAVIALKAERRWVVTGTPIQNSSFDLFSLMAFLGFQPFSIKSYWRSLVQRPLEQGSKSGLSRLQALLGAISLRRTKEGENGSKRLVGLPRKTIDEYFVELSAEEREYYDQMELEGQNTMREFNDRDSVLRNYSTVLYFILRLRQLCDDVALCPLDIKSWLPSNSLEDVSKNPELLKKLASLVEDGDDFDCPICLSPPARTVITCCTHIYCQTCILKILKSSNSRCPICRQPLSKEDLFVAPEVQNPDEDDSGNRVSSRSLSSKVQVLLKLLMTSKNEDPSTKSVVFSQFRKMLILLEEPLKAAGFDFLRLDGSMSAKKRSEVIKEFGRSGPGAPTVLLASLKAAGAGVNLTAASAVYIFDPWWNPGVEEQAMDRVHRIGQKKEVKVVRLIVKGSIEERILELQERKKKLVSGAFGRKAAKDNKEVRVEELRMMMGL